MLLNSVFWVKIALWSFDRKRGILVQRRGKEIKKVIFIYWKKMYYRDARGKEPRRLKCSNSKRLKKKKMIVPRVSHAELRHVSLSSPSPNLPNCNRQVQLSVSFSLQIHFKDRNSSDLIELHHQWLPKILTTKLISTRR
jgi:hypothetical protein